MEIDGDETGTFISMIVAEILFTIGCICTIIMLIYDQHDSLIFANVMIIVLIALLLMKWLCTFLIEEVFVGEDRTLYKWMIVAQWILTVTAIYCIKTDIETAYHTLLEYSFQEETQWLMYYVYYLFASAIFNTIIFCLPLFVTIIESIGGIGAWGRKRINVHSQNKIRKEKKKRYDAQTSFFLDTMKLVNMIDDAEGTGRTYSKEDIKNFKKSR